MANWSQEINTNLFLIKPFLIAKFDCICFFFTGDVKFVYDTDTPDESGNWGPYEMGEKGCSRTCG